MQNGGGLSIIGEIGKFYLLGSLYRLAFTRAPEKKERLVRFLCLHGSLGESDTRAQRRPVLECSTPNSGSAPGGSGRRPFLAHLHLREEKIFDKMTGLGTFSTFSINAQLCLSGESLRAY